RHLREHVQELKPTVIVVGYGSNEAFDGLEGLPRFEQGLKTLLDTLAATKARIVILSPLRQEYHRDPPPETTRQNENLGLYAETLRKAAAARGYPFVNFYEHLNYEKAAARLTDNGIHLSAYGYYSSSIKLKREL